MEAARVYVRYFPRLYQDLLNRLFKKLGRVEVIEDPPSNPPSQVDGKETWKQADVILISLNQRGLPAMELLPNPAPNAKLIAFSMRGDLGLKRMPGESVWIEVRPFGLVQLIREVRRGERVRARPEI